jgi:hypothetical protein
MQRRHIGEVQGRHRHVPRPVVHIAGVHGKERSLERCDLAHQPHAVLMRDAADAGDLGVERRLISAKTVMVIWWMPKPSSPLSDLSAASKSWASIVAAISSEARICATRRFTRSVMLPRSIGV